MTVECPTCEETFDSEMGMKTHHWQIHDEKIGVTEKTCKNCGEVFEVSDYKDERGDGVYCSTDCHFEGMRDRVEVECSVCDSTISVGRFRTEYTEKFFCSKECECKWMEKNYIGSNNPNWKEESFNIPYGSKYYKNRERVLERDGHKCISCDSRKNVEVHHIYPRRKAFNGEKVPDWVNEPNNLVCLCVQCHNNYEGEYINLSATEFIEEISD